MDTERISAEVVAIRQRLREISQLEEWPQEIKDEEERLRTRMGELQSELTKRGDHPTDADSAHTEADRMHYIPPA